MLFARLTVIELFSAPGCVIRQYAVNIWYDVDISLTIGKRSRNRDFRPHTDQHGE
jgi:hypothetical protein